MKQSLYRRLGFGYMGNSRQPEYDMVKVQGLFVGYRKFAVDRDWLRQQEEQRYRDRQR